MKCSGYILSDHSNSVSIRKEFKHKNNKCNTALNGCADIRRLSRSDLDVSAGVDLVHSVSWSSTGFTIQVVALDEDGVIAQTANPDVPFPFTLQLDALPNVQSENRTQHSRSSPVITSFTRGTASALPRSLDRLRSVDVAELTETEAVSSGGVHVPVHGHDGTGRGNFKGLAHLNVHLEVSDGAPVLWSCPRAGDHETPEHERDEIETESNSYQGGWISVAGTRFRCERALRRNNTDCVIDGYLLES